MLCRPITLIPATSLQRKIDIRFAYWCKHYNITPNERGLGSDLELLRQYAVIESVLDLLDIQTTYIVVCVPNHKIKYLRQYKELRKVLPHRFVDYNIESPRKYEMEVLPGEIQDQLTASFDNGVRQTKASFLWREKFPILALKVEEDANFRKRLCLTR